MGDFPGRYPLTREQRDARAAEGKARGERVAARMATLGYDSRVHADGTGRRWREFYDRARAQILAEDRDNTR